MATLEDRVAALETKVEQFHLFDQMTSHIIEVIQQSGREAVRVIINLGERHDRFEDYVRGELTTLHEQVASNTTAIREINDKFETHTVLLHRILKRLGDEE